MKKGVVVSIIVPFNSYVKIADWIRDRYLAALYNKGVQIYFYNPGFLHSKLLVVDDEYFLVGSSNVDYRSFLRGFEVNLLGEHKKLVHLLEKHFEETLQQSEKFNYPEWKKRSTLKKLLEKILYRIKHYF